MRHRLNINKATIIHTLVLFLHLQQSSCDIHSISWNFLGSEGLSLPHYTESDTVNDVTLFYYDSNMKSTAPCPEWLNTTAGQQYWKEASFKSHYNMANMALALQTAKSQFNLTAPEVRLFERQGAGSTILTCHVTGFYPRAVQVKWIGADLQLVKDEINDVLPNGDGTFQTRSSVIRPEENTGDQRYSCVVHHSSLEGNITVTWGKEEKPFRLYVRITLGCVFIVTVVGLVIRGFFYNKGQFIVVS
ncbi:H-2 class I histocompatibility antigen, Q7 alpha chain isoform X2 [Ictalurus punctatus]|uniref:H-2 class I histocompatibility antigen, Q7 alpha chain isoform X2 n=1 Tax=Ictalurus punctatus TaxID=7998 RepID=A0A9F7REB4_ICTPU|nr:H-2 class I histocompatibility antigen, Q7 alpha chain isoform X2 [Ictalurus punctatus]